MKWQDNIDWKSVAKMQVAVAMAIFGRDIRDEIRIVSDGCVHKGAKLWWKGEFGPEYITARHHWSDILDFPEEYTVNQPKYKVTYLD